MKRNTAIVFLLALFSLIDGYLLSAISLLGRAGISLFYTQYQFLKSWWKGAILVFVVWLILYTLQSAFDKRASKASSNVLQIILLLVAAAGLYFSYADFRNSLSHRWLGERFHLGVYLFWIGWMTISLLILSRKKPATEITSVGTL